MQQTDLDRWHMQRALELAARGEGWVEPNPMVGCVIAQGAEVVAEGWHRRFGGPHAEAEALAVAGPRAAGATMYVTLEPCCHHGKTPPCTAAILEAGVARVVAAQVDPFPQVAGQGLAALRVAGLAVEVGVMEEEARRLNAPFRRLIETGRPWVIAKWAMTLDGKIATCTGDSRWISSEASRAVVHQLRGRMDAIVVGSRTAATDDPLLTARPADAPAATALGIGVPGLEARATARGMGVSPMNLGLEARGAARVATRIVVDSRGTLSSNSQLVRTARETPMLVAVGQGASPEHCRLSDAGCEVLVCPGDTHEARLRFLLAELGRREMTNVLVEGGSRLLGSLFDANLIDEVHVFVAPKLVGGAEAPTAIAGRGRELVAAAQATTNPAITVLGSDVHIHARLRST